MGVTTNLGKANSNNQRYIKFLIYQGVNRNRKCFSPSIFLYDDSGSVKLNRNQKNHNKIAKNQIDFIKSSIQNDLNSNTNQSGILHKSIFLQRYKKHTSKKGNFHISAYKKFQNYVQSNYSETIESKDIDYSVLNNYLQYLEEEEISQRTINSYIGSIKSCLSELHRLREIEFLPDFRKIKVKVENKYCEALSEDEIDSLKAVKNKSAELKSFLFSYYTGLRACDLKYLKYTNISKEGKGDYVVNIVQKKTGDLVSIPLNKYTNELIDYSKIGSGCKLFTLPSNQTLNNRLRRTFSNSGVSRYITFRFARNSFAQYLLRADVNIKTISVLMGHKNIQTTNNYIYANQSDRKEAIKKLY